MTLKYGIEAVYVIVMTMPVSRYYCLNTPFSIDIAKESVGFRDVGLVILDKTKEIVEVLLTLVLRQRLLISM